MGVLGADRGASSGGSARTLLCTYTTAFAELLLAMKGDAKSPAGQMNGECHTKHSPRNGLRPVTAMGVWHVLCSYRGSCHPSIPVPKYHSYGAQHNASFCMQLDQPADCVLTALPCPRRRCIWSRCRFAWPMCWPARNAWLCSPDMTVPPSRHQPFKRPRLDTLRQLWRYNYYSPDMLVSCVVLAAEPAAA